MENSNSNALILTASAGSGKTYQLAYNFILDALRDQLYDNDFSRFDPAAFKHTLAVTFTNKATKEMKDRIVTSIHLLASGQKCDYTDALCKDLSLSEDKIRERAKKVQSAILHDYSHLTILTNDKFFQRVFRAFLHELGADLNYAIQLETEPIIEKGVDALLKRADDDPQLRKWINEIAEENVTESDNWDVRKKILSLKKELFSDFAKTQIDTPTSKEDLKTIIAQLKDEVATIEKELLEECAPVLDNKSSRLDGRYCYTYLKNFVKNQSCRNLELPASAINMINQDDYGVLKSKLNDPQAYEDKRVLNELHRKIYSCTTLQNNLDILRSSFRSFSLLRELYDESMKICSEDGEMLLGETKNRISKFIGKADEAPFIYEKIGTHFDRFMIDEFQDTSRMEWNCFMPLLRNAMSQSQRNVVLIVGDIKQSIYRWRGGDWNILAREAFKDLSRGGFPVKEDKLHDNWRSCRNIVNFNNAIFSSIVERGENEIMDILHQKNISGPQISEKLKDELENSLSAGYKGHAQNIKSSKDYPGYITITEIEKKKKGTETDNETTASASSNYSEDGEESNRLATTEEVLNKEYIKSLCGLLDKGYHPSDIMFLVRTNIEANRVAYDLLTLKNTVPEYNFDIITQEALKIYNAPEVEFIISTLTLALHRKDPISLGVFNRHKNHGDFLHRLSDEENELLNKIQSLPLKEAFEEILLTFKDILSEGCAYIATLHENIMRFCRTHVPDIDSFLKWWEECGESKSITLDNSLNAIEVMTIHKAKGLEKKIVFIPFCDWSTTPKSDSIFWGVPEDIKERIPLYPYGYKKDIFNSMFIDSYVQEHVYNVIDAINTLYVALTRAKEQLHIFIREDKKTGVGPYITSCLRQEQFMDLHKELFTINCVDERHWTIGELPPLSITEEATNVETLQTYEASRANCRIHLSHERYIDERGISPTRYGIAMHAAFEEAECKEDILRGLEQQCNNLAITREERDEIIRKVNSVLEQSPASEWFTAGAWENIFSERTIIRPGAENQKTRYRPDRVMTSARETILIDYKFGEPDPKYQGQLRTYMNLLRKMNYPNVKGYIWYVEKERIEEVVSL